MNTLNNMQSDSPTLSTSDQSCWTAGPIIKSYEGKSFNRTGEKMKLLEIKTYVLEVFPPDDLITRMQQPSPDIINHLQQEGVDVHHLNKRHVAFLAHVSLPTTPENSAVEITLTSEQRQDGGVYKHEISVPRNMISVHDSPVETVLDTLNNALNNHNWYPSF